VIDIIGWIGAACFALCAIPQLITTLRLGHAEGVSGLFLALWFVGEVCMLYYVAVVSWDWILLANYIMNLACLVLIIRYKIYPRRKDGSTI
jgi:uncharacterized protein with PQ loop repeat